MIHGFGICSICNVRPADQWHHPFIQSKAHVKHYGRKVIDHFRVPACSHCNVSHANMPEEYIWNEKTFREHAEAAGFTLPPPMKSFKKI